MPLPTKHVQRHHSAPPDGGPSTTSRYFALGTLALIVLATCVAYYPAMQGQFIWDDNAHVTKPELRSLEGLRRIWFEAYRVDENGRLLPGATQQYYPLLHSAFWLEHELWGDNPLGYHLVNLLQHALAACLVFLILRKLRIPGALLAAAIFALHPVQVESVAWITEQKNTLSAVFYLSAMLAYLHFDESRKPSLYSAALALFVLGLLSKTVTATLPAALLVIFWWQRGSLSWKRDVRPLIPFFVLGAIAGVFTAWVERTLIGAEGAPFELSILQRCLLAGRVIWFYLGNLLWPANLIFIYPRWEVDPAIGWQWLFPLAAISVLVALYLVRRQFRGPLAGWLFFVGTLFPVLGFFNVFPFLYSFVADHFQYLASLGMIVLAASGLALAIARLPPQSRWIGNGLCVALLAVLATLTWRQAETYSDIVTLYKNTIDKNPTCWMAYNNLGNVLADAGKVREAMEKYQQALQIRFDYPEAHYNLARQLDQQSQPKLAIEHYLQVLKFRPFSEEVHTALGIALLNSDRPREAIQQFHLALQLNPHFAQAHFTLGNALFSSGQLPEAIEQFQQTVQLDPNYVDAHLNLGLALANSGEVQKAIQQFEEALRLKPDYAIAHCNLGKALYDIGRPEEAVEQYRQALRIKPDYFVAHFNLANTLREQGHFEEALDECRQMLRLKPDDAATYSSLTKTLAALNRSEEAIATAQKALELARSQGEAALAQQIEDWLNKYRSQAANPQNKLPQTGDIHSSQ